jgi:hypothetical protein
VLSYIRPDENRLSDIISDLLDPTGTHGQGSVFLHGFLEMIAVPSESIRPPYRVSREDRTLFERRIDITLVVGDFGIGIENKPWADEGENQLKDYMIHLRGKYGERCLLVYLSGDGSAPVSLDPNDLTEPVAARRFKALSYSAHLHQWLKRCLRNCQAEKVRWFLHDLMNYVESEFEHVEESEESDEAN